MDSRPDIDKQLDSLEAGRGVLEKLLTAATSLESLRVGLESSLQLGQQMNELPVEALQLYHALGSKIRQLSDSDVLLRLQGLDIKVQINLEEIIPLVEAYSGSVANVKKDPTIIILSDKVDKFKRLAKTAITLRVLLYKRGLKTEPLALSVPEHIVLGKLKLVESKEKKYRDDIKETIGVLEQDITALLNSGRCPNTMKQMLQATLCDLAYNKEHVDAGLSIQELPVSMELVEFSDVKKKPRVITAQKQARRPTAKKPTKATTSSGTGQKIKPPSWWRMLIRWLNEPWAGKK